MDYNQSLARMIEEMAANAWPAPVQQQLEGWKLRAANGVTRRANSVFTANPMPKYERWLDLAADFYRWRGLPVRFLVSDASPGELERMLVGLGYEAEGHSSVHVAAARDLMDRSSDSQFEVAISAIMDDHWLELFTSIEDSRLGKQDTYRQIMSGIGPPKGFAQVLANGKTIGVGMVVIERGWAGLYDVATHPDYRRKGVGTQIVRSMVEWATQHGAANIYLQVMTNNRSAIALYEKLGFRHLYSYHYRTLEG